MTLIERDDLVSSLKERFARLIFDKDCVTVPAEQVFEKEETSVTPDGGGVDRALVVYAKDLCR